MPCLVKKEPRPMTDEQPTKSHSSGEPGPQSSEHLSGLTEAIGGLDPAATDHDPLIGTLVGEVKIVRRIAEGGMGRVYEGLQEKPRRPVAVKVMRPGFVSREACRRFDNESEVLGRLRHPYIAQIFSAGICTIVGAQVPYFVMELIPDALPITKYAAAKKLSINDRIELFRKVCEAVAHGHEKNVIHRDLKPSNILVEPNGVPKIIDFGVSRCVDASAEALTALTDMGQLIGTVQYMSPEQFSANPLHVDVRADVYTLGVILYELLANRPPYEIRQKEIFEAARVVRECKPVSPAKLNQSVRPDLVRITGTCLQKDRNRRYASAAQLANALESYLVGTPVLQPGRGMREVFADAFGCWRNSRWAVRWLQLGLPLLGIAAVAWWWFQPAAALMPPSEQAAIHFNGHAYRIFLEPATQAEAVDRCRKQGGYLAQIETAAENAAILAAAVKSGIGQGYLWIGGYRPESSDPWLFEDKKPMSFFHRGVDWLDVAGNVPHALTIAVDSPVAYWQPLNIQSRTSGFICEWNDYVTPQGRPEP